MRGWWRSWMLLRAVYWAEGLAIEYLGQEKGGQDEAS